MKVRLQEINEKENEEVVIHCVEVTPEVTEIFTFVQNKGTQINGLKDGQLVRFSLEDVYYFEAVDEKVFAYTKNDIYDLQMRLYKVEELYESRYFIRCSKSVVLNLMMLEGISPALNGRFIAHMKNKEKLMITRGYVPKLKNAVIGKGVN